MKTVIVVQARMTSSRLPGKILREVLGKPLLEYQIERLKRVARAAAVVIATTVNAADEPVEKLGKRLAVPCFRGSENDVLSRYYFAAREHAADSVVRVTSDCPLIDPAVIDQVIALYQDNYPRYAYASNIGTRTYPRGMDTEVFSFAALAAAQAEATLAGDREHVTPFIRRDGERFPAVNLSYGRDASGYRWTVDTAEDFLLIKTILTTVYADKPSFTLEDCLDLLAANPEWSAINEHVRQKEL